jgi:hypothetical protein
MLPSNRSVLFVSMIAIACLEACSAPQPPSPAAAKRTDIVLGAKASEHSQAKLGITTWHTILQPNGFVFDGSDAKGRVKFATVLRGDAKTGTLRLESYGNAGGALVIDIAKGELVSNTIEDPSWGIFAAALAADWKQSEGGVAYGLLAEYAESLGPAVTASEAAVAFAGLLAVIPGAQGAAAPLALVGGGFYGLFKCTQLALQGLDKVFPDFKDPVAPFYQEYFADHEAPELPDPDEAYGDSAEPAELPNPSGAEQTPQEHVDDAFGQLPNQNAPPSTSLTNAAGSQMTSLPPGPGTDLAPGLAKGDENGAADSAGVCLAKACSADTQMCICTHY